MARNMPLAENSIPSAAPPCDTAPNGATKRATKRTCSDIENQSETNPQPEADTSPTDPSQTPSAKTAPTLYSYEQYAPSPAIVYTRDEEEADEMARLLKGPLGFDLEWVVTFRRGKAPMDRRTALVQLSDARMILLVQVSAMKRKSVAPSTSSN